MYAAALSVLLAVEPVMVWLVDAMLSEEMRLALANMFSTESDGSAAHCFRGPGSLLSQETSADSIPGVKCYLIIII